MVKKPTPTRQTSTKTGTNRTGAAVSAESGSKVIRQKDAIASDGNIHVNVEVGGFTGTTVRRQAMFWVATMAVFVLSGFSA
jgi:hypothetical protein